MPEALYRKYRPQIFEDVVGQEFIERTLKNAIDQNKVSHAYLFTGPRGTGKTTTARLLAKALLCEKGPTSDPDGTCEDCKLIASGTHPDVYELDAASRTGVENVREEIIGRVHYAPTRGRYKIYIIDEVHMLSTAAFNALLKTLEEPPDHVVFILCTTNPRMVPETIHSRCQRFEFRRIAPEAIVSRLGAVCVSENVEFEGEALDLIAHQAGGGLRDALTSLEQVIAFGEGKVTLAAAERLLGSVDKNDIAEIVEAIGKRDIAACFNWTASYVETGADFAQFTRDLSTHMRNMYVLTFANTDIDIEISDALRRELIQEMEYFGPDRIARMLCVLGDLQAELKTSTNQRLSFEIALIRMTRPDSDLTLESLAERIEELERKEQQVPHPRPRSVQVQSPEPEAAAAQSPIPPAPARKEKPVQEEASLKSMPQGAQAQAEEVRSDVQADRKPPKPKPQVEEASAQESTPKAAQVKNPASLQRTWQVALARLKKANVAYGMLFMNTKAVYDEEKQSLRIDFPPENQFAFQAVQKKDVKEALEDAIVQAFGRAYPFSYFQASPSAQAKVADVPVVQRPQRADRESMPKEENPKDGAKKENTTEQTPATASPKPATFETPQPSKSNATEKATDINPEEAIAAADAGEMQTDTVKADRPSDDAPQGNDEKLNTDFRGDHEADPSLETDDIASILEASFGSGVEIEEIDGE
ncbi:MAG: DNA polymerase III subunit gamma/tau [Eggerthellaceae bacterium]|jgi:DNA polymerase-3 subunit gamma/tau